MAKDTGAPKPKRKRQTHLQKKNFNRYGKNIERKAGNKNIIT